MTVNGQEDEAVDAMRSRGLDNPLELLAFAEPAAIIATCKWWDRRKAGVGLLAKRIRDGGVDPVLNPAQSKDSALRALFTQVAERFPVGAIAETHQRMAARCWPKDDEQCAGRMVVLDTLYPAIAVRCDGCGFEASYPLRAALEVLPSAPLEVGVSEPSLPEPGPMSVPPPVAFHERDKRAKELAGQILRDVGVRPARTSTEAA